MSDIFSQITQLAAEWQALQPPPAECNDRLWKKLRLEWNFHSNHIEGNTLTYGETELLLLHDRTTGNHTHREYVEMKAHNVGIEHVRALATDRSRPLTEGDVRDLNRIILKESFWKPAVTGDGQPTRKEILPGQYKTTPNSVRTATGEIFHYASVEDTHPRMQALASWMQDELAHPTLHPVAFATKVHYDFIRIHPFDDGNGRVARLLVNYVLMRAGYLPIIVRTEDKATYLTVLQLADAGDMAPMIDYIASLAKWSLELGLRAAKGEPIDEPSDIEKEIAVFVRNQQHSVAATPPRTTEAIQEQIDHWLLEFLRTIGLKLAKINPLFSSWNIGTNSPRLVKEASHAEGLQYFADPQYWGNEFQITYSFNHYRGQTKELFSLQFSVGVFFKSLGYEIRMAKAKPFAKPYGEFPAREEQERLIESLLIQAFEVIKEKSGASVE